MVVNTIIILAKKGLSNKKRKKMRQTFLLKK